MSTPKSTFGATVIDKKIFVCGGHTDEGDSRKLEVFEIENEAWTELESMEELSLE